METEAIAVAQDANNLKVLYLPPQYMTEDATPADKAAYEHYKKVMANQHMAKQSGIILPFIPDQMGNKMFELDIKSVTGTKSNDVNAIIGRYNAEILTCLFADFLSLGSSGSGSFSLAESKITIVEMVIQSKLDEIKAQLNHDLVRQLFEINGWSTDVMPTFEYGSVAKESLDEVGKFIQRIAATGNFPQTRETINFLMDVAGIEYRIPKEMSQDELNELLTPATTKSGSGMASGMPNGQGNSTGSGGDASVKASTETYKIISRSDEYVTVKMNGIISVMTVPDFKEFEGE